MSVGEGQHVHRVKSDDPLPGKKKLDTVKSTEKDILEHLKGCDITSHCSVVQF